MFRNVLCHSNLVFLCFSLFSAKMSLYGFPILSIPDILVGLADMFDINIEEASFRKPDVSTCKSTIHAKLP